MFILQSYQLAVIFCVITMFCWGSWANTQKLARKGFDAAGRTQRVFNLSWGNPIISILNLRQARHMRQVNPARRIDLHWPTYRELPRSFGEFQQDFLLS
jgi:hypothetical protein